MGELVQVMMKPVHTYSAGRCLRRITYSSMVYPGRSYWHHISACLSDGFIALVALDRRTPSVATRGPARHHTAGYTDCAYHAATRRATYRHRTPRSAYRGRRRALPTKFLFLLFVCTSFLDRLFVFERHCYHRTTSSRSRFCSDGSSHRSSKGEQLLLFLSTFTMLL